MLESNTAIILFIYNRPDHTKKVLEGLRKNNIKKLYVFADGPKSSLDLNMVNETRKLINNIDWCEVVPVFRKGNLGLANSIINGIESIIKIGYESFIVLEDDCVPKEGFINFMQQSLQFYKNNDKVMHISGFGLPIKKYTSADVYFTPYPCSWGWGTWTKVWRACNFNQTENYKKLLKDKRMKKKFNYSGEAFSEFLQMQIDGKINSWLIRWYFFIFQNNGRCLWSYKSFIENKGFDGSGVHKNKIDRFNQKGDENMLSTREIKFEQNLNYNGALIKEFRRHFMGKRLTERIKTTIYLLTGLIIGK